MSALLKNKLEGSSEESETNEEVTKAASKKETSETTRVGEDHN